MDRYSLVSKSGFFGLFGSITWKCCDSLQISQILTGLQLDPAPIPQLSSNYGKAILSSLPDELTSYANALGTPAGLEFVQDLIANPVFPFEAFWNHTLDHPEIHCAMDRLIPRSCQFQPSPQVLYPMCADLLFYALTGQEMKIDQREAFSQLIQQLDDSARPKDTQNHLATLAEAFKSVSKFVPFLVNQSADNDQFKLCALTLVYILGHSLCKLARATVERIWDNFLPSASLESFHRPDVFSQQNSYLMGPTLPGDMRYRHLFVLEAGRVQSGFVPVRIEVTLDNLDVFNKENSLSSFTQNSVNVGDFVILDFNAANSFQQRPNVFTKQFSGPFFDVNQFNPIREDIFHTVFFQFVRDRSIEQASTNFYVNYKYNNPDRIPINWAVGLAGYVTQRLAPSTVALTNETSMDNSKNPNNDNMYINNSHVLNSTEELCSANLVDSFEKKYVIDSCTDFIKHLDWYTWMFFQIASTTIPAQNIAPPRGIDMCTPKAKSTWFFGEQPNLTTRESKLGLLIGENDEDGKATPFYINLVKYVLNTPSLIGYEDSRTAQFHSALHSELYKLLKFAALPPPNFCIFAPSIHSLMLPPPQFRRSDREANVHYTKFLTSDALLTELAFYGMPCHYTTRMTTSQLDTLLSAIEYVPVDSCRIYLNHVPPKSRDEAIHRNAVYMAEQKKAQKPEFPLFPLTVEDLLQCRRNALSQKLLSSNWWHKLHPASDIGTDPSQVIDPPHNIISTPEHSPQTATAELYRTILDPGQGDKTFYVSDFTGVGQFPTRGDYNRYGALAIFDGQTRDPIAIWVSHLNRFVWNNPASEYNKLWAYAKYVWKTTFFMYITVADHLTIAHLVTANSAVVSTQSKLKASNPLRNIMKPSTFSTVSINLLADDSLYSKGGFVSRIWAYDFDTSVKAMHHILNNYTFKPANVIISPSMTHEANRNFVYKSDLSAYYNASKQIDRIHQREAFFLLHYQGLNAVYKSCKREIDSIITNPTTLSTYFYSLRHQNAPPAQGNPRQSIISPPVFDQHGTNNSTLYNNTLQIDATFNETIQFIDVESMRAVWRRQNVPDLRQLSIPEVQCVEIYQELAVPLYQAVSVSSNPPSNGINPDWDRAFPYAYDCNRLWAIIFNYMSSTYDLLCDHLGVDNLLDAKDSRCEEYVGWFTYLETEERLMSKHIRPEVTYSEIFYQLTPPQQSKLKFVTIMSQFLMNGSGVHEAVGTVVDYMSNATMIGVKLAPENMLQFAPTINVQAYTQLLLLTAFTGAKVPGLLTNCPQLYFDNPSIKDNHTRANMVQHYINWLLFKYECQLMMVEVDFRNAWCRDFPLLSFQPRNLEGAVSI